MLLDGTRKKRKRKKFKNRKNKKKKKSNQIRLVWSDGEENLWRWSPEWVRNARNRWCGTGVLCPWILLPKLKTSITDWNTDDISENDGIWPTSAYPKAVWLWWWLQQPFDIWWIRYAFETDAASNHNVYHSSDPTLKNINALFYFPRASVFLINLTNPWHGRWAWAQV